jgi:putative membrane protein
MPPGGPHSARRTGGRAGYCGGGTPYRAGRTTTREAAAARLDVSGKHRRIEELADMNTLAASWHDGGPGPWILLVPLVWAAVVIGVVTLLRRTVWRGRPPWDRRGPGVGRAEEPSPVTLLGRRFAAGEIDEDEYWRRLSVLDQEFGARPGGK